MKRKILLSVLVVSLALNAAVFFTVGAHWLGFRGFHRWPKGNAAAHFKQLKKTLDLSDKQANAMEENRQTMDRNVGALRDSLRAKKMELLSLIKTTDTYTPQIDALIGQTAAIQMDIEKDFVKNSFEIRKILTPEQHKKFDAMLEKGFRKAHRGRRGACPGPDRGPQPPPEAAPER